MRAPAEADPEPVQQPPPEPTEPSPADEVASTETPTDSATRDGAERVPAEAESDHSPVPAIPVGAQRNVLDGYQRELHEAIQNARSYPHSAMVREQEGAVRIQFSLSRDGRLLGRPVIESPSRYGVLNRAAVQAVLDAAPFPPFPDSFSGWDLEIRVTIRFSL